ncbi:NmrA family NAD(P)-binding protein [Nostoc sp. FACHB-152]|uniref:SDR family oxidoreductase n=1 Tax=unclassified Nostoc TaxID=2593658 RepID=UPI0016885305|nr:MULTISPECIES: NmrA family NAD(P)-binding protein [unclassified Nostoc]MBD2448924.1 NmrA family NAD(P)-binding protein [Nostoc sp. FACHB-152]MBD2471178.1 NmrA family NAD(P)-binding protein [Nostoc sp. FACHB-145]
MLEANELHAIIGASSGTGNASKILVTGGTGSLGSLVVDRLQAKGCNVQILSHSKRPGTVQGDLLTGEGLEKAVEGIDVIIHCASSPTNPRQVDVEGTKRLLHAAEQAGVAHFVFISIVGVDRNRSYPYYAMKLEVEQMIEQAAIPWTILRATQFHEFVLTLIQFLDRLPIMLMPKGFLIQPIEASEVADRLVELALSTPAERVTDIGGPKVWTAADLARTYFNTIGQKRRVVEIPLPGKVAQAFRTGVHLCPEQKYGKVRWDEFLNQRFNKNLTDKDKH